MITSLITLYRSRRNRDHPDHRNHPLPRPGASAPLFTPTPKAAKRVLEFFTAPVINDISRFEITHPFNLRGDDVLMRAPQFYLFGATQNTLLDTFNNYSTGDLNLRTGEVTNLNYSVIMFNIWYGALGIVNPTLKAPPFTFPGIYGAAEMIFEQRPDGRLDFTFTGSTFLPLGSNINGEPVRLPMPFCGPELQCGSIQVPGMSLHPRLRLTSKKSVDTPCGARCAAIAPNTTIEMTLNSRFSSIGDDFFLNIPLLGGFAIGRSQMQGRMLVQFGEQTGDFMPVAISALPPSGFAVPPPPFPIRGLSLGFLGHDEKLRFPNLTYDVKEVAITDDPFDIPLGELNVKTGQFVGGLLWRTFWNQDLLLAILDQNLGRILPASFLQRGPALFEKGPNDSVLFRYDSGSHLIYDTFIFPAPAYKNPAAGMRAGAGSLLTPFFRMQGVTERAVPTAVMTGSQANVLSSFGERFSYNFSIPCDPLGRTGSFEFTNTAAGATGGTFTMKSLVAVQCLNSRTSTRPPGQYDTVTFTAFGSWSKDEDPHVATVQISIAPDAPYVTILIDGGTKSNVNTKPAEDPIP